jgi:predicted Zn-dependent protease
MNKGKGTRMGWMVAGATSIVAAVVILFNTGIFNADEPILRTTEATETKETTAPTSSNEPVKEEAPVTTPQLQVVKSDVKKEMTEALKSMQKEDYNKAVSQWLAIIKKDPKNSDAHAWLAASYGSIIEEVGLFKKMKYNDLMEASINDALTLDPESTLAHMIRGRRYLNAPSSFGGNIKKAIEDFQFCIENGRDDAEIYYYLGQSYEENGDRNRALKAYENALKKDPKYTLAKERLKEMKSI